MLFAEFFLTTRRLACPRVFALSRTDHGRERTPVLPRLFALPHWSSLTLLGFWTFVRFSSSPELQTFLLSKCIDAPESTTEFSSFHVVSLVFRLCCWWATRSPSPFGSTGVLWVLTETHPCDDSPRQGGEPSERQLVLWNYEWTGACS